MRTLTLVSVALGVGVGGLGAQSCAHNASGAQPTSVAITLSAATSRPEPPDSATQVAKKAEVRQVPSLLTVVCEPLCEQVIANGRPLGPSPVVREPVPPGELELTLVRAFAPSTTRFLQVPDATLVMVQDRLDGYPQVSFGTSRGDSRGSATFPGAEDPVATGETARLWSGSGMDEEVRLLKAICRKQGDRSCVERAEQLIRSRRPSSP